MNRGPGISPIPYEAVAEAKLDWDLMDVRCADLRETIVTTEFHLSASDAKVDICLYNDSYGFAVYVENRLAPRDAWRQTSDAVFALRADTGLDCAAYVCRPGDGAGLVDPGSDV